MTWTERAFRFLLRAYPERTRDAYGDDMVQLFTDQLHRLDTPTAKAALWLDAIGDTLATAPRQHLDRSRVPRTAVGPPAVPRPLTPDLAAASLPLLFLAVLMLAHPGFLAPTFDNRVSLVGLPAGFAIGILFGALASLGVFAVRRGGLRGTRIPLLAVAATIPALVVLQGVPDPLVYAALVVGFILAVRYRLQMAALIIPFVMWILLGPSVIMTIIAMGST